MRQLAAQCVKVNCGFFHGVAGPIGIPVWKYLCRRSEAIAEFLAEVIPTEAAKNSFQAHYPQQPRNKWVEMLKPQLKEMKRVPSFSAWAFHNRLDALDCGGGCFQKFSIKGLF